MCLHLWLRTKEQKSQNDDHKKQNGLTRDATPLAPQGWNAAFLTEVGTPLRTQPFLQEFWGYLIEDYHVFQLNLKRSL